MRPLDQPGHIANGQPVKIAILDNANLRMQRRKRVRRNLRASVGDGCEQGGLSRVRIAHQSHFRDQPELELVFAFRSRFPWLGKSGRLPPRGGKVPVPEAAAAALAENEPLAM